ncbi:MAG: NB-ARC domain-containing protein [Anaerolineaceae bacterium]|nr:NB-ARC domain-containing protein [Anaerolineaceae bacterium]
MQLGDITNEVVETCLRAIRSGEILQGRLLDLAVLDRPVGRSPEERALRLEDLLHELVWEAYRSLRLAEGLPASVPETRSEILGQIGEDFSRGNSDLEAWNVLYFRYLAAIPLSVEEISGAANIVPQQMRRRLRQSLTNLAHRLRRMELEAQRQLPPAERNLPLPDYTHLVGVQAYFQTLAELFGQPEGPRLVSLEGIGGIGKTALARAFVSLPETQAQWHTILWVSARQYFVGEDGRVAPVSDTAATLDDVTTRLAQQLGLGHLAERTTAERLQGLRAALQMEKSLVVVDNLETVAEYAHLVPALAQCAGRSRFLITSRQTLRHYPYVHTLQLAELNSPACQDLVQAETARRGHPLALAPADFEQLYRLVGGVPLAVKLVAAQLPLHPLAEILERFSRARAGMDELYRYLYWQTWQSLGDDARRLLLAFLPTDPEGEDLAFLQAMSGQPEAAFFAALRQLDQFSLLEISGSAAAPRYRLHRLTVTFLQTDILKLWEQPPSHDPPSHA